MPQALIPVLLLLALVVPILGAAALRIFEGRLGEQRVTLVAAVIFVLAALSTLALGRSDVSRIQVAGLTLLLPVVAPSEGDIVLPPGLDNLTPAPDPTEVLPAADATAEATGAPTFTPTAEPPAATTKAPTATAEPPTVTPEPPTVTPEPPTATPEPPTPEPPTATPVPAGPRMYTVQPGDTLRSIAEQFGVSVAAILDANNLTPAQADALRPGQELVIP